MSKPYNENYFCDNYIHRYKNEGSFGVLFLNKFGIDSDEIRHIFGQYGKIVQVKECGDDHGHRFVKFSKLEDAEAALAGLSGNSRIKLLVHKDPTTKQRNDGKGRNEDKNKSDSRNRNEDKRGPARGRRSTEKNDDFEKRSDDYEKRGQRYSSENENSFVTNRDFEKRSDDYEKRGQKHSSENEKPFAINRDCEKRSDDYERRGQRYSSENGNPFATNRETQFSHDETASNCSRTSFSRRNEETASVASRSSFNNRRNESFAEDDLPELVTFEKKPVFNNAGFERKPVLIAEEVVVANISPNYGAAYILHLFERFDPIAVSHIKTVKTPSKEIRFCHIYFKGKKEAIAVENSYDDYNLDGKRLIVLRPCRLVAEATQQ